MICNRKAKIVATLGPSSSTPQAIRALFDAGVDVFRLNFSHGAPEDHRARVELIRQIETETGRPIAIMMDLQGPKLRVGKFAGGSVELKSGQPFRLDMAPAAGDQRRVSLAHPEIFQALEAGTDLLLDDGKLKLRVERCGPDFAETTVVTGGKLSDRKGVNVPGVVLPISAMTDKDRQDLNFGLRARHRLGGAVLRAAARRRGGGAAADRQARRRAGEAGEAGGDRPPQRADRAVRCGHGGARRSRRGDAAGGRAGAAEEDHRRLPREGEAGGGSDADAGLHGAFADADPRRGLRRGYRDL